MRIKSSTIKIFSIFLFLALFLQIPIYHGYSLNKDKNDELEIAEEEVKEPVQGGSEAVVNTKQTIKIKKVDPDGKPLAGVKFTLNGDAYTTDSKGEVEIPVWKYPEGEMKLIEPEQTINGVTYTKKEIPVNRDVNICKDKVEEKLNNCYDGVCFWGEVEGNKLMTYDNLISQLGITEGSKPNISRTGYEEIYDKNAEEESKGGIWLKFTDSKYTRNGKPRTYYVMKKPARMGVSWNTLHTAGAVYGWDVIDLNTGLPKSNPEKYKNISFSGTDKDYKAKILSINGEKYIVRLLQGKTNYGGDVTNTKLWPYNNENTNSEWNRTILPITQGYRFGSSTNSNSYVEQALRDSDGNSDYSLRSYKVQTANYNWFGDLTLSAYDNWNYNGKNYAGRTGIGSQVGQSSWTQEFVKEDKYRSYRGSYNVYNSSAHSYNSYTYDSRNELGVRLVLEPYNPQPIPGPKNCYDGVCFQCEVDGSSLISYENLVKELGIAEGKKPSIPRAGYEEIYDKNAEEESKGGIWLKFTDSKYTRDGKPRTYYVMKKPVRQGVSWNTLHTAGAVYGWDVIDPNTGLPKSSPEKYKNIGKYGNNADYKGKIITINGEKYIVRLLQGKTNYGGDVTNTKLWSYNGANANSEWNRTMLPITQGYRFGSSTNSGSYAEQALRDSDGNSDYSLRSYKVQTANYNWFGDLTLGAYEDWNYNGKKYTGRNGSYVGQWNWVQEFGEADYYHSYRGRSYVAYGAASSSSNGSSTTNAYQGARLVLEPLTTSY